MLITFPKLSSGNADGPSAIDVRVAGSVDRHTHRLEAPQTQAFVFGSDALVAEVRQLLDQHLPVRWDAVKLENTGTVIIATTGGQVFLVSDLLASFPTYWSLTPAGLCVSNRLTELSNHCNSTPDPVGIIEFLRFGYCVGDRTLASDIRRLQAGELLAYTPVSGTIESRDQSSLWTNIQPWQDKNTLIERGAELLIANTKNMDGTMLMMSGGWDSRTLLAGALENKCEFFLYNHGDMHSREARIVNAISNNFGLKLISREIDAAMYAVEKLNEYFLRYENLVFPHWHAAGERALEQNATSITAGVYGEILGGHHGPPMLAQGYRKPMLLLKELTFRNTKAYYTPPNVAHTEALQFLFQSPYQRPWYFENNAWLRDFDGIHHKVNDDIERVLNRYLARGVCTTPSLIEAFITEHNANQYMVTQLRSAASETLFNAPFATRSFIEYACSAPFSLKVHNSLNQQIIKKLAPRLLDYPMAATLCKARRPILLQEGSRGLRKLIGEAQTRLHKISGGRTPASSTSWVNFQFMSGSGALESIAESLQSEIFDKQKIRHHCTNFSGSSYHPMTDMSLKIKTVDMLI